MIFILITAVVGVATLYWKHQQYHKTNRQMETIEALSTFISLHLTHYLSKQTQLVALFSLLVGIGVALLHHVVLSLLLVTGIAVSATLYRFSLKQTQRTITTYLSQNEKSKSENILHSQNRVILACIFLTAIASLWIVYSGMNVLIESNWGNLGTQLINEYKLNLSFSPRILSEPTFVAAKTEKIAWYMFSFVLGAALHCSLILIGNTIFKLGTQSVEQENQELFDFQEFDIRNPMSIPSQIGTVIHYGSYTCSYLLLSLFIFIVAIYSQNFGDISLHQFLSKKILFLMLGLLSGALFSLGLNKPQKYPRSLFIGTGIIMTLLPAFYGPISSTTLLFSSHYLIISVSGFWIGLSKTLFQILSKSLQKMINQIAETLHSNRPATNDTNIPIDNPVISIALSLFLVVPVLSIMLHSLMHWSGHLNSLSDCINRLGFHLGNPDLLFGLLSGISLSGMLIVIINKGIQNIEVKMQTGSKVEMREKLGILSGEELADFSGLLDVGMTETQKYLYLPIVILLALPIIIPLSLGLAGLLTTLVASFISCIIVSLLLIPFLNSKDRHVSLLAIHLPLYLLVVSILFCILAILFEPTVLHLKWASLL